MFKITFIFLKNILFTYFYIINYKNNKIFNKIKNISYIENY